MLVLGWMMLVKKRPSVLFIGRFQPFHRGHEKLLHYLSGKYARIVIGIGSSQYRRTSENPFSAGERKSAIRKVITGYLARMRDKISYAHLADYSRNADWVAQVVRRFPPSSFSVASANPLVRRLLGKAGYELDPSPLFNRDSWEGAKIRKNAREGKNTKTRMPAVLGKWMEKTGKKVLLKTKKTS